jgi:uncharacterized protein (DUF2236 family)
VYYEWMLRPEGPIHVTPTARRLGRTVARAPLPGLPGPLVDLATLPALSLLPARIRTEFGLAWGPGHARLAWGLERLLVLWIRLVPDDWRAMPQARSAERRARAARIPPTPTRSEPPATAA